MLTIAVDVNAVLTALDQETIGNLSARRARLLKTVGVLVQMIWATQLRGYDLGR